MKYRIPVTTYHMLVQEASLCINGNSQALFSYFSAKEGS